MAWQDRLKRGASFYDVLTDNERAQLEDLYKRGHITEADIPLLADRFMRAPNRENALEQAFKSGEWGRGAAAIRDAIADPSIGARAAEEFFDEKGVLRGLGEIGVSAVTTPVRSWSTILRGELGQSDNPWETLVGAASVIPVGRLGANLARIGSTSAAKRALRAGSFTKAATRQNRANYWGSKVQSRAWKYPSRAVEAGDVVTGAPEWPLEALGEVMLDVGGSIGASTVNKIRNQEGLADQIVNLAEQIKTDHSPQQKIAASVDMVDERVFQALVDQNEDIENVKAARDVVYNVAYLKYLERNIKSAEEAADGNAQAEPKLTMR